MNEPNKGYGELVTVTVTRILHLDGEYHGQKVGNSLDVYWRHLWELPDPNDILKGLL